MITLRPPHRFSATLLSKRALQLIVAIGGFVPVGAGLAGVLAGPAFVQRGAAGASLQSHFSYLSGLLLGIGLLFWWAIPAIERRGPLVRALTLIVVVGGLGRVLALWRAGPPDTAMRLAFAMELVVTPALCLWQWRLERRMDGHRRGR